MNFSPQRIVCLTEESAELIYLLGEEEKIVGISGFTVRPERARKEKPKVSLFTDASIDKILKLEPDLVIGFSDIQADIASDLIKEGITVWINNHRSIEETMSMIWQLGVLLDQKEKTEELLRSYRSRIDEIKAISTAYEIRPKVYFEEWYDPLISGIEWVSELIEICGGEDIFKNQRGSLAKDRIIEDHREVIQKNPDIILVSWCGKMFKKKKMLKRDGWDGIEAVKKNEIHEIDSAIILQPGPAAFSDGMEAIHQIISNWTKKRANG